MGRLAKMDVIYDTGSDWLIVEGSDCTNCEGNTYNIGPSLETQDAVLLSGPINHNYGASNFVGKEYTDTVCILFSACVSNFKFLLIEQQTGLKEPVDGVLGMARNRPQYLAPELGNPTGSLYFLKLATDGVISEHKFSFYISEPGINSTSFLDLGEPNLDNIRNDTTVKTTQLIKDDYYFAGYCQGVAIGSDSAQTLYAWENQSGQDTIVDNSVYSIIDTGASAIMISALYYESLIEEIMTWVPNVEVTYADGYVQVPCEAYYPNIYFMFDLKWIEVSARDYVKQVGDDVAQCAFHIRPTDLPMNILGMPLLMDYYSIHDAEAGTIGWAPHSKSNKLPVRSGGTVPSPQGNLIKIKVEEIDTESLVVYVFSWLITIPFIVLFIVIFYSWLLKEYENNSSNNNNNNNKRNNNNSSSNEVSSEFVGYAILYWIFCFLLVSFFIQPVAFKLVSSIVDLSEPTTS